MDIGVLRLHRLGIASITARGFWADAALSRKTSGLPRTVCDRIGKSSRMRVHVEQRRGGS